MITLKLTHYSYAEMVTLRNALIEVCISVKCPHSDCSQCQNKRVCEDLVSAVSYIERKIVAFETLEPDHPSDCF